MLVFGLTGGISTGKSTVSSMFRALGALIVDADVVARQIVEPGQPAFAEIAERFPQIMVDGAIDRAALGAHIFRQPEERAALNAITHPRVRQAVLDQLKALEQAGAQRVLYDVPLLFENRLDEDMSGVIVVTAPLEIQRQRLMARNGFTAEQADQRIASQLPLDEKRRRATWVIDNGGSLEATRRQVETVWQQVLNAPTR